MFDRLHRFDFDAALDLSAPIAFDRSGPQAFGLPAAEQRAVEAGSFIGDTDRGGPCNCRQLLLCPHGNGTHTESRQHIDASAPAPAAVLTKPLLSAALISVEASNFGPSGEHYNASAEASDRVLCAANLGRALDAAPAAEAIVIRCADEAYLTFEAMDLLIAKGLSHIIVPWASIDRPDDGGELPNHHRFFAAQPNGTVTELAHVPAAAVDGAYLLNLQLPNLATDAVPSRPLLIPFLEL